MYCAVDPVVPGILENEEDGDLEGYLIDTGKGYKVVKAEEVAHKVEEPDLRELDGEVGEKDKEGALPLFLCSRDLVLSDSLALYYFIKGHDAAYLLDLILPEPRDHVDDNPRQRAAKVDSLVYDKGHDTRGENIVVHVRVPSRPKTLGVVE